MVNNVSLQSILKGVEQSSPVNKTQAIEKTTAVADKLQLSEYGINLQQLSADNIPQASPEQLSALRDAIASGAYKVDYDKLAEALINQSIIDS